MKKGALKNQNKYLSIVLIPHTSDKVKVFKFSAFYYKIATVSAIVLTLCICAGIYISYTVNQNETLKSSLSQLKDENIRQSALISEKSAEINELKEQENVINSKINDVMNKYRELTNSVVSRSGDVRSDRPGAANTQTIIKDMNELRSLITVMNETRNTQSQSLEVMKETEEKLAAYMDAMPTIKPTAGRISSYFGGRRDPFQNRSKFHEGMDFAAPSGQSIKASASGTVVFSGYSSGYGYNIIINHGNKLSTLYGHCSKLLSKKGQKVKKGEVIAKVGNSGRSTGPHLHFEVRINGEPVDPLKYLTN